MVNDTNNNVQEIDIKDLIQFVLRGKKWLFFGGLIGLFIGVFLYLLTPKEYTSTIKLLPSANSSSQYGSSSILSQFSGLAGLSMSQSSVGISTYQYAAIVATNKFQLDLLGQKVHISSDTTQFLLKDLIYSGFVESPLNSVIVFIKTYTIGLPSLVRSFLRDSDETYKMTYDDGVIEIGLEEALTIAELSERIILEVNESGIILIGVSTIDPVVSAEVAQRVSINLTNEVRSFYLSVQSNQIQFLENKKLVALNDLNIAEEKLTNWKDANSNIVTERIKSVERKLSAEYKLAYDIYSTITTELESTKIKINENLPVLKVIDPPVVSRKPSYPSPLISVFVGTFLGLFVGFGTYFMIGLIRNLKARIDEV